LKYFGYSANDYIPVPNLSHLIKDNKKQTLRFPTFSDRTIPAQSVNKKDAKQAVEQEIEFSCSLSSFLCKDKTDNSYNIRYVDSEGNAEVKGSTFSFFCVPVELGGKDFAQKYAEDNTTEYVGVKELFPFDSKE
jgi:hypothetical protein